jgi:SAM-dependent methyltransferase
MDDYEYAINVFDNHVEKASLLGRLSGKTIVELGPGDSVATAVIASAHGARAILVDSGPFVDEDVSSYLELGNALSEKGLMLPREFSQCCTIDEILTCCDALYYCEGLVSLKRIKGDSIDLIFSQAVLEHVRKRDFAETVSECRRILRPTGICSHQVDLRDHIGGALNNLRFAENVWESELFASSGFYTNRISFRRMMESFSREGFDAECGEIKKWDVLPIQRDKIDEALRASSDDDLCVAVFDVLLRPKQ